MFLCPFFPNISFSTSTISLSLLIRLSSRWSHVQWVLMGAQQRNRDRLLYNSKLVALACVCVCDCLGDRSAGTRTSYQNHEDRLMACLLDRPQASHTRQDWPWTPGARRLYFSIYVYVCACLWGYMRAKRQCWKVEINEPWGRQWQY